MPELRHVEHRQFGEVILEVERVLRAAGIPSVLWDTCLLTTYGVPVIYENIDFVVPDHHMDAAFQALKEAGFSDSKDPKDFVGTCTWHKLKKEELTITYPYPTRWLHLHPHPHDPEMPWSKEAYVEYQETNPHADICLHPKSFALWALPDMALEDPAPDDPNYMLANDPRLPEYRPSYGQGRFDVPGCRLQIPTPTRFTESLFLFMARERDMLDRGEFWDRYLCYIDEYVYKKSIDEEFLSPATMEPSLGRIWRADLRGGLPVKEFDRRYIDRLRHNLIKKGVLPETAYPGCLKHDEVLPFILRTAKDAEDTKEAGDTEDTEDTEDIEDTEEAEERSSPT